MSLKSQEHEEGKGDQQQDGEELVLDHIKEDGRGTSFNEHPLDKIDEKAAVFKINKFVHQIKINKLEDKIEIGTNVS